MLGKKIKFKLPKVPGKNFLKGKFVILEPAMTSAKINISFFLY